MAARTRCGTRSNSQDNRPCARLVGSLVDPLRALHRRARSRENRCARGQRGGRKPRRRKPSLSKAAVEEYVPRGRIEVLDLVLHEAADDAQRVDGIASVHEASEPPWEMVASEASISRVPFDCEFCIWMSPVDVKMPST